MELTLQHRIRERAYFLSLARGGAGDGMSFWLIAEREGSAAHGSPWPEAVGGIGRGEGGGGFAQPGGCSGEEPHQLIDGEGQHAKHQVTEHLGCPAHTHVHPTA